MERPGELLAQVGVITPAWKTDKFDVRLSKRPVGTIQQVQRSGGLALIHHAQPPLDKAALEPTMVRDSHGRGDLLSTPQLKQKRLHRALSRSRVVVDHANPDAKLTIIAGIGDKDAERLQQLAAERHQRPGEVISSLLRSA